MNESFRRTAATATHAAPELAARPPHQAQTVAVTDWLLYMSTGLPFVIFIIESEFWVLVNMDQIFTKEKNCKIQT